MTKPTITRSITQEDSTETEIEFSCPRCGALMQWLHANLECAVCRYKEGCCEGAPQRWDDRKED